MDKEEILFKKIADKLSSEKKDVQPGKMMSSPGIIYKNKVFAFYFNKEMTFKLGKEFNPKDFKIKKYSLLSPFKNKPPMSGWFQISIEDKDKWEILARQALKQIENDLGSKK